MDSRSLSTGSPSSAPVKLPRRSVSQRSSSSIDHTPRPSSRLGLSRSADLAGRPSIPLDFLRPTTRPRTRSNVGEGQKDTMAGTYRRSIDSERPLPDPSIKGIPQSFPDDPTINPASPPRPIPTLAHSTPDRRLGTLRESTRVKLFSFSGFLKETSGSTTGSKLSKPNTGTKHRPGLSLRSSSLATDLQLPQDLPVDVDSTPSVSAPSQASHDKAGTEISTTEDFTHLFTPTSATAAMNAYAPSMTSTESSSSNRDRVLGLRQGDVPPNASRIFLPPKKTDVVPFAADHPFAAWEPSPRKTTRRPSIKRPRQAGPMSPMSSSTCPVEEDVGEGWRDLPQPRGATATKRVWVDETGEEVGGVYRVGWERDVLDLEARLHETMWQLAGESHTFCSFPEGEEPKAVLDIGTGTGIWPISQALEWKNTHFVGFDLVPCQTDLSLLTKAELTARSTSTGKAAGGMGTWESIENRIQWERGNFLKTLPYDTGVFDLVHIRFIGLGVPESRWGDLLEECSRVLKRGGTLEIVETSYTLPTTSPTSLKNSFASLLLADLIQPQTILPLRFNIPLIPGLVARGNAQEPVFNETWMGSSSPPGALRVHVVGWVRSALEYKGTGLVNGKISNGAAELARRELCRIDSKRWSAGPGESAATVEEEGEVAATIWAWIIKKA